MHLSAVHIDGFTEHLLTWVLVAENGSAVVKASWLSREGRVNRTFELTFPDSRIQRFAEVLAEMRPKYDGCVDDTSSYKLCVAVGERTLSTEVLTGIDWPKEDKPAIDAFMSVWIPLSLEVENLLAIPGRLTHKSEG